MENILEKTNNKRLELVNVVEFKKPLVNNASIKEFIDNSDIRKATKKSYIRGLTMFMDYCSANKIYEPTKQNIIDYKEFLQKAIFIKDTKGKIGYRFNGKEYLVRDAVGKVREYSLEANTINFNLTCLFSFYEYMQYANNIKNITKKVKLLEINKLYKKDSLTIDEAKALINSIDTNKNTYKKTESKFNCVSDTDTELEGLRNKCILDLLIRNGLRVREIESIDIEDIKTLNNYHVIYVLGKGKDTKTDFIVLDSDTTFRDIMQYIALRGSTQEKALFVGHGNKNKNKRLSKQSISLIITKHLEKIGAKRKGLTPHSTRHFVGTQIANSDNADAKYIAQKTLRHYSGATTEIYFDRNIEIKAKVMGQQIINNVL